MREQIHCPCNTKECLVLKHCSPEWIKTIDKNKNQTTFKKGQYLFREGDRVFGLYFIQNGKVKIISTGLNDKEHVVRLATVGHVVGHRGYGHETYPVGAIALEDTVACFIDNSVIYDAFMKNPEFTYSLMMFYSYELRRAEVRERHLVQMTIREKVADALLYLKEMFGMDLKEKCLNVNLSRREVADIAGMNPEQMMRTLTELEKEGLIAKKGKKIVLLNIKGLSKIISNHNKDEYSNGKSNAMEEYISSSNGQGEKVIIETKKIYEAKKENRTAR